MSAVTIDAEREAYHAARRQELEVWNQDFKTRYPNGYIVSQRERNLTDDSFFTEWLFLADKMEVVEVSTGSTAYGCPSHSSNLPWLRDASDQVKQAYKETMLVKLEGSVKRDALRQGLAFTETVMVGSKVGTLGKFKVKGEEFQPGTEGKVFWVGKDKFSGGERFGIEFEDGRKAFVNGNKLFLIHSWVVSDEKVAQHVSQRMEYYQQLSWSQIPPSWYPSIEIQLQIGETLVDPIAS